MLKIGRSLTPQCEHESAGPIRLPLLMKPLFKSTLRKVTEREGRSTYRSATNLHLFIKCLQCARCQAWHKEEWYMLLPSNYFDSRWGERTYIWKDPTQAAYSQCYASGPADPLSLALTVTLDWAHIYAVSRSDLQRSRWLKIFHNEQKTCSLLLSTYTF